MKNLMQKLRAQGIAVTPSAWRFLPVWSSAMTTPAPSRSTRRCAGSSPAISFNTVYKTLEVLCQKGLVSKVNPLHEVARYDGEMGRHVHLICRRCHTIADLHWQPEALPALKLETLQGFRVEYQSFILWGLCSPAVRTWKLEMRVNGCGSGTGILRE